MATDNHQFLTLQTCELKVNINCDGCMQKVKKILNKIEGVCAVEIDAEQNKVTVKGVVEPATLIMRLHKLGKHAELSATKRSLQDAFNQSQVDTRDNSNFSSMAIDGPYGDGWERENRPIPVEQNLMDKLDNVDLGPFGVRYSVDGNVDDHLGRLMTGRVDDGDLRVGDIGGKLQGFNDGFAENPPFAVFPGYESCYRYPSPVPE
ncbi:hypothetical protein Droror1_Dr00016044 [Drosera rotundifolia]